MEEKRKRRVFTPEQKFVMLQRPGLPAKQQAAEGPGSPAIGSREQKAQGGGAQSVLDPL